MLINYEILEATAVDDMSRFKSRRVPSATPSIVSTVSRPSTCAAPERISSAMSRSQGPASRVYRNVQRQLYKLWYDQAIPPPKALAYLRGRAANDFMFTVSGHPVQISTSINLQPKTPETGDTGKSGLPDVRASSTRGPVIDGPPAPHTRSSFRETSKKSLLSPSYYAASSRDNPCRRQNSNVYQRETSPVPHNGLVVSAQPVSTHASPPRPNPAELGLERAATTVTIVTEHGDARLDRSDEDEVDGSISHLGKLSHDKIGERCGPFHADKPSAGSDSDPLPDGILISNSVSYQKSNYDETPPSRATTATVTNFSRRTRPFSSMTTTSSKTQSKSGAGDLVCDYPDPFAGGPASFQQRLMDLAALENETLRWERLKASRRKSRRQD